jgi:excisionase family DNA binding protein
MGESEWVSLREAAEMLGVHPATVRNWADNGDLPSRRTPGGHRRFRKTDLTHYAATQNEIQPIEAQAIVQNALWQTRMQVGGGTLADLPWYAMLSETARNQLRQQGLNTMESLRNYLARGSSSVQLEAAVQLGQDYAALLNTNGLNLVEAVKGFFYFTDTVVNSILNWSEIPATRNSPAEWGSLLRHVNLFINHMLLAIVEYYESKRS